MPVYFLYSSKDELIGEKHIDTILKTFRGSCEVSDVGVRHNDERPAWITDKIMAKLVEHVARTQFQSMPIKKRGLSITKTYMQVLNPKASQVT